MSSARMPATLPDLDGGRRYNSPMPSSFPTTSSHRSALARAGLALALAGAPWGAYGSLVERRWFRLREESVPVLAPDAEPLDILHLSDLHMLAGDGRLRAFLGTLAERPVDLLVVTGDMLGEPEALEPVLDTLERFEPRLGAVAVLVPNDYSAPRPRSYFSYFLPRRPRLPTRLNPWRELVAGLERAGWGGASNHRAPVPHLPAPR